MSQIIISKNRPKLEITLQEEGFEILDNSAQSNNGIYSYSNLKSVKINQININLKFSVFALDVLST